MDSVSDNTSGTSGDSNLQVSNPTALPIRGDEGMWSNLDEQDLAAYVIVAEDLASFGSMLNLVQGGLDMRRRLLKRSKAVTMDKTDKASGNFRSSLGSLPETEETVQAFPNLPDNLLKSVRLFRNPEEDNKNLNEPDIEERFARLALAFKTDKFTLGKRLDLQKRQRDVAEKNIEDELNSLRESLNALNQLCTESDMREIITKTQQHVDIVQRATLRMSNRAETYGAIQQEERLNCAFETMLNYVEHLKLLYDKEHIELEEYRRLLAVHNLLPGEKGSIDADDAKRSLPPRSHSLSSSSKPEFLRRCSLQAFIRAPYSDAVHKVISRENSTGHLSSPGFNANLLRQKLESRTRLLSSVCLLNNNYEAPRPAAPNGASPSPGSVSPKSRRSSLPVGPTSHVPNTATPLRTHNSIHEIKEATTSRERRESQTNISSESDLQKTDEEKTEEGTDHCDLKEKTDEERHDEKDSSELNFSRLLPPDHALASITTRSLQESTCDNETDDICLLPEISIPVKPKPLYSLKLIQWASLQHIWRWDNATIILHARYTLSVMLATAAMLTFVLTFVPNQVLAYATEDSKK